MIVEPSPLSGFDLARLRYACEVRDQSPQNGPAEAGRPVRPIFVAPSEGHCLLREMVQCHRRTMRTNSGHLTSVGVSDGNP